MPRQKYSPGGKDQTTSHSRNYRPPDLAYIPAGPYQGSTAGWFMPKTRLTYNTNVRTRQDFVLCSNRLPASRLNDIASRGIDVDFTDEPHDSLTLYRCFPEPDDQWVYRELDIKTQQPKE